ncbi:MAG: NlpC/P60 family protein [Sandaracinobacteroides sp.]
MTSVRISGPRNSCPLGPLDPRENAWRDDLADIALADRVAVPNYVRPVELQALGQTPMLVDDRADAVASSELLPGERFAVLDSGHGFAWGFSVADHYVGHVALEQLGPVDAAGADGLIGPGDALLFRAPQLKAAIAGNLPAGARVRWRDHDERHVELLGAHDGLFLNRRHLLPAGAGPTLDWVDIALNYLGAPYRWGGRSRAGVDCSGLVQVARHIAGLPCRRDSDMQAADAAHEVAPDSLQRGDIACWPGHIGILLGAGSLLHANAFWMSCVAEPLADVLARAAAGGTEKPRYRRF